LPEDLADFGRGRAALRAILRLGDDALAGMQPGGQLRPAFNGNPAEPVLDEVPGGKQAVLISRTGCCGCPVSLELCESRRVKAGHSRADRRRLTLWQRHDRLLPLYRQMAHESDANAPLRQTAGFRRTLARGLARLPTEGTG